MKGRFSRRGLSDWLGTITAVLSVLAAISMHVCLTMPLDRMRARQLTRQKLKKVQVSIEEKYLVRNLPPLSRQA